jgi:hypothetical protein
MRQTGEIVRVAGDTQQGGVLKETVGLGPSAFDFEPVLLPGRAVGSVFSTASGRRYHARAEAPIRDALGPRTPEGGETLLNVAQAYEREPGQASLSITISRVLLDVIDRTDPTISTLVASRCCGVLRMRLR